MEFNFVKKSVVDKLFNNDELYRTLAKYDELEQCLINVSGYDLDQLLSKFSAGWTLEPPKYTNVGICKLPRE